MLRRGNRAQLAAHGRGALVGAAIGTATAWALKYDKSELAAGIYGFNSALVGIAIFFFFSPGAREHRSA